MDYEAFKNHIRDNISDYMLFCGIDIEEIRFETTRRGEGICIREIGAEVAPVIYLESYYNKYLAGADMDDIINDMVDVYREGARTVIKHNEFSGNTYSRSNLFLRALNYENNKEFLKDCIYERTGDIAIEVRYLMMDDGYSIGSTSVGNADIARWGVSRKEIFEQAKENTPELFPIRYGTMEETLSAMTGQEIPDIGMTMLVVTNERKSNGAAYIAYPEMIDSILQQYGIEENCYIFPSSIHEILVLPEDENALSYYSDVVRDVNMHEVSREDFLSDNIYKFDAKEKTITQLTDVHREKTRERDNEKER